jgi:hypothetical protein
MAETFEGDLEQRGVLKLDSSFASKTLQTRVSAFVVHHFFLAIANIIALTFFRIDKLNGKNGAGGL